MLQLSLFPDEYITINGDIVVQLAQVSGPRAYLRVEADRSIPIVRGKVLERTGVPRPACLAGLPRGRGKRRREAVYHWSADRERAVQVMEQILDRMEAHGRGGPASPADPSASHCVGGGVVRQGAGPVPQPEGEGSVTEPSLVSSGRHRWAGWNKCPRRTA